MAATPNRTATIPKPKSTSDVPKLPLLGCSPNTKESRGISPERTKETKESCTNVVTDPSNNMSVSPRSNANSVWSLKSLQSVTATLGQRLVKIPAEAIARQTTEFTNYLLDNPELVFLILFYFI